MAFHDTLAFGAHDSVTGPPAIDGAVMADEGVPATFTPAEPGYVGGARYVFQNGALPPVVLQTVRQGNTIVIGIFCRGDMSFDTDFDACVICLRESYANPASPTRRIDIFPVYGDEGDPVDPAGTGRGADDLPPAFAAAGPAPDVRTGKPPRAIVFYRPQSGPVPWQAFTPANAGNPALFHARVRSWRPPTAAGSPPETAWSIELRVPVSAAAGGGDWITLQDRFGLYINLIRGGRTLLSGADADYFCTQFRFPHLAAAGIPTPDTRLFGLLDASTTIPSGWYGRGLLNPTAADVQGVRFQPGYQSVGRRPRGNTTATPTGEISATDDNDLVALLHNSGPAVSGITADIRMANWGLESSLGAWSRPSGLQNPSPPISLAAGSNASPSTGTTVNQWDAAAVQTAGYASRRHQCMWVQLSGPGGVNFTEAARRRNMDFVNLSSHEDEAEISGAGYPPPPDGQAAHDFLLFTRCREMVVREIAERSKEIDPETLALLQAALANANPDDRAPQDAPMLRTAMSARAVRTAWWADHKVLLWITEGFRRTGRTLTIGTRTAMVLDEDPGAFGIVATHQGVGDLVGWSLSGPGLVAYAPGITGIRVPPGGRVRLRVKLEAGREVRPGDQSDLPRGQLPRPRPERPRDGGDGGRPMKPKWWWLLLGLFGLAALRRLLKR